MMMLAKLFPVLLSAFGATMLSGMVMALSLVTYVDMCLSISFEISPFGPIPLEFPLLLDTWSLVFASTVLLITCAVVVFSKNYMALEKFFLRFHFLVLSFAGSMLLLIFSPSMISLLMGWDGLGVTSFLLVVYFQSGKSLNAGLITALSNRVGDCILLLSLAMWATSISWMPFFQVPLLWASMGHFMSILLIWAAFTKSAQVPFSAWLPAAMAAPTPVSSLVHSSTLVTAGVYLLCRYSPMLESFWVINMILPAGVATMLMAGASALFETDMKKIVALSTLSQLGLMMSALGVSLVSGAMFHLLTHAFFKALLFMTVGNLIHLTDGLQDSRKTGSIPEVAAPTLIFSLIANFSLMGLPFMAGFYSKDLIMEAPATKGLPLLIAILFYAATSLTAAYTVRFIFSIMAGKCRSPKSLWSQDLSYDLPLSNSMLAPLAVMGGSLLAWGMLPSPSVNIIPNGLKNLTSCAIILGATGGAYWWDKSNSASLQAISWNWGLMWSLPVASSLAPLKGGLPYSQLPRSWDLSWVTQGTNSPLFSMSSLSYLFTQTNSYRMAEIGVVLILTTVFVLW